MLAITPLTTPFLLWPEYNQMIGMGWRPKSFGPSVHIGDHDEVIEVPAGQGFDPIIRPASTFQSIARPAPSNYKRYAARLDASIGATDPRTARVRRRLRLSHLCSFSVTQQNEADGWVPPLRAGPRPRHHAWTHLGA